MHENERVDASLGNELGRNNGLSERGWGAEYALII